MRTRKRKTRGAGKIWAFILLIIITVGLAYSNIFQCPFVFDSLSIVPENYDRLTPYDYIKAHRTRPVSALTFILNHAVSGRDVWSYHALNLLIHILAALTLFGIVRRALSWGDLDKRYSLYATTLAFSCTLLWALHPLQTQAVTYTVQRHESLMGLCFLLTLYCAIRGWQKNASNLWQGVAVLACLVGVGSKQVIVAAPFIVALYDVLFVHNNIKEALRSSRGMYMGFVGCLIILAGLTTASLVGPVSNTPRIISETYTFTGALLTQFHVILHYIRLAIWPDPLIFDYFWTFNISAASFGYALIFLGLAAASLWALQRRRPAAFPALWFFIILAPSSGMAVLGRLTPAFEHRMYLPLAGLAVLAVMGIYEGGTRLIKVLILPPENQKLSARIVGYTSVIVVALLLGTLTFLRNQDYQSGISIWADTVQKRPQNHQAHHLLGAHLIESGQLQEGIPHLQHAIKLQSDYPEPYNSLGIAFIRLGQPRKAIPYLQKSIRYKPDMHEAYYNLGVALEKIGRLQEAIPPLEKAIKLKPDYAKAYRLLGVVLHNMGQIEAAIPYYRRVLDLTPNDAIALTNMGNALYLLGKYEDAIGYYQKALQITPNNVHLYNNVGLSFFNLGKYEEAKTRFQQALNLDPEFDSARRNLNTVINQLNK